MAGIVPGYFRSGREMGTRQPTGSAQMAGARCPYRCTIDNVLQPPSFWTDNKSTRAITSREANEWRFPCHV